MPTAAIRRRNGWSLRDMSAQVGVPVPTLQHWEVATTAPPLDRLSVVLSKCGAVPVEIVEAVRAAAPDAWPPGPLVPPDTADRVAELRAKWAAVDLRRIFGDGRARVELAADEAAALVGLAEDLEQLLELVEAFVSPPDELVVIPATADAEQEAA